MIRRPVVVILGSTGTGKTKLSLELAKRYGGEVISADSMQVYSNLDIVTAKATKDEQAQAKHHLLDVAQPGVLYSVRQFQNSALPIIDNLLEEHKTPIIVGGTNYYIESLLWKILVDEWKELEDGESANKKQKLSNERVFDQFDMNSKSSEELHEKLKQVDPESAKKLHPNNKRKIIRALEVFERSGKPFSWFIDEQMTASGGSALGGPLRYENLIIFWLCCEQETLNKRLDKRVDEMVKQGLLGEIRHFYEKYVKPFGAAVDYTKGILQTIGFKEFEPYLLKYDESEDRKLEEYFRGDVDVPESLKELNECLDRLKLVTQRYSKKQIKWVKNRFLRAADKNREIPPIYQLDTTNPDQWDHLVSEPAHNVIDHYLDKTQELKVRPLILTESPAIVKSNTKGTFFCDSCQRVFVEQSQWEIHRKSNRHKKVLEKLRKQEKNGKPKAIDHPEESLTT